MIGNALESEARLRFLVEKRQRNQRRVDVPLDLADVVARALLDDLGDAIDADSLLQQSFEPRLPIANRGAVHFENIAQLDVAIGVRRLHEQQIGAQRANRPGHIVAGADAPGVDDLLPVSLLRGDSGKLFPKVRHIAGARFQYGVQRRRLRRWPRRRHPCRQHQHRDQSPL